MASKSSSRNVKRWFLDIHNSHSSPKSELPYPFSYLKPSKDDHSEIVNKETDADLVVKKSWDIASGPIKQVPMNLFMLWMAGNSISIFPIMMVGMMLFRPIQTLFSLGQTFKMIEGSQAPLQKAVFVLGNLVAIGLGLYKINSMGLLPTHASDWLAFVDPPQRMEYGAGGISMT